MRQDAGRELDPEIAARTRDVLRAMVRDERGRGRRRSARIGAALAVAAVTVIAVLLVPRHAGAPPAATSQASVEVICMPSAALGADEVREIVRPSPSRSIAEQALEACAGARATGVAPQAAVPEAAGPEAAVPDNGGSSSDEIRAPGIEFQLGGPQNGPTVAFAVCARDDGALVVAPVSPGVCSALGLAEFEEGTP